MSTTNITEITKDLFNILTFKKSMVIITDNVNLLRGKIDAIKKNRETLTDLSREVGLKVNSEKTKYMLLSHHQNAGQNPEIKTANRTFENVAQFKYLGTTVTDQNLIQEEIKSRM
jgi:hypothetical protein